MGYAYGSVYENDVLTLTAPEGTVFTDVLFASYGTPNEDTLGECNAANSVEVISSVFLGQNSGSISASNDIFGDPCGGVYKNLNVILEFNADSNYVAPLVINPPTNLVGVIDGSTVILTWDAPTEGVAPERYAVTWRSGDGGWGWASTTTSVVIPFDILSSTNGLDVDYSFSIRSDNDTLAMYSTELSGFSFYLTTPTPAPSIEPSPAPVVPTPEPSPTPEPISSPEPVVQPIPETQPSPSPSPSPSPTPVPQPPVVQPPVVLPEPEPPIAIPDPPPSPEPEIVPEPTPPPAPEPSPEPVPAPLPEPEPSPEPAPIPAPVPAPEPSPVPTTQPEPAPKPPVVEPQITVDEAIKNAMSDGTLTEHEKEIVAGALIEAANGAAVSAADIKAAGLTYEDLPPQTPVEVRTDANGNEVVITAEVAAALVVLASPSELVSALFSDPGQVLLALGSIGADMSPQEREESTKAVVATVVAGGAAITAASSTHTGSSNSGGNSGGGSASGDSKGVRRRNP